jgi:hypothetical protein
LGLKAFAIVSSAEVFYGKYFADCRVSAGNHENYQGAENVKDIEMQLPMLEISDRRRL